MRLSLKGTVLVIALFSLVAALGATYVNHAPASMPQKARASADGVHAVISPLEDEVSNGTRQWLRANESTAPPGMTLLNYTWIVEFNNVETYSYGLVVPMKFEQLGLYKITLIVSNTTVAMNGSYDIAFTAVYSILDGDKDSLPDWWEMYFFRNLDQTGSGDADGDKYTNLEEYARGTDPTVKNSQPGLADMLMENWIYLAAIAGAAVVAFVLLYPRYKRKQKDQVKKKIAAAIEIEKALDMDK